MYSGDDTLRTLRNLTERGLRQSIAGTIPEYRLDAPVTSYRVANIRYKPRSKLVIGLVSDQGGRPVSLRVLPNSTVQNKLEQARERHPRSVFLLEEFDAVAWVFPGEKKLDLDIVECRERLNEIFREYRGLHLIRIEPIHIVPEHTYTARAHGKRPDGSPVCEYLKIYYDDAGERTARIMQQITKHGDDREFVVPSDVSYFPEHRLMIQAALPRNVSKTLEEEQAARVLASFHALSVEDAPTRRRCAIEEISTTRKLVEQIFPGCVALFDRICDRLPRPEYGIPDGPRVLLHGDAHLGNLFPLYEDRVGIIDLDAVHRGAAVNDLSTFYAFKLWLSVRQQQDFSVLLNRFSIFIAIYNSRAAYPVDTSIAYRNLALRMITERIHRGITRGKLAGQQELLTYLEIADQCVKHADKTNA